MIYITTPNFASLERRVFREHWGLICYPEHISYYSPKTIDFLTKCGYEKVSLRTENISIFRIVQFLNRLKMAAGSTAYFNEQEVADAAQKAVTKNPALTLAKKMINAILNVLGIGTSLVAVYRKVD